jgi:DNA invertase Pin-like site-specific DNA recombinase
MAHMLASVAQYETEVRAERVIAGQARARAEGKTWGGSEKGRRLKVTDEQVTQIRRLRREGESVAAIARATSLTARRPIPACHRDAPPAHKGSRR